jgi:hypothetical protein
VLPLYTKVLFIEENQNLNFWWYLKVSKTTYLWIDFDSFGQLYVVLGLSFRTFLGKITFKKQRLCVRNCCLLGRLPPIVGVANQWVEWPSAPRPPGGAANQRVGYAILILYT